MKNPYAGLDEFIEVTSFHRKHAIRALKRTSGNCAEPAPRSRLYDEAVSGALTILWEAADRICGKRLKEAIPTLVDAMERHGHLNRRSALKFEPDAMPVLMEHNWPGNVRELENVVERAVVLTTESIVPVGVLPEFLLQASGMRIRRDASGYLPADASLFEIVADYERRKIVEVLESAGWSQTGAAEALRIPLSTLNQKIKRLNIEIHKKGEAKAERGA
jgi:hypothetical protein